MSDILIKMEKVVRQGETLHADELPFDQGKIKKMESQNILQSVTIRTEEMFSIMAFSSDNQYVVGASNTLGEGIITLFNANDGQELVIFKHDAPINYISLSLDNKYLLFVGGGKLKIWTIRNKCEFRTLEGQHENAAFSPDSRYILSGDANIFGLYAIDSGKRLRDFTVTPCPCVSCPAPQSADCFLRRRATDTVLLKNCIIIDFMVI